MRSLLFLIPILCTAQTYTFSVQDPDAVKAVFLNPKITVWGITVCRVVPNTNFSGVQIRQVFEAKGYSMTDRTMALRQVEQEKKKNWAVVTTKVLGVAGILSALGGVVKSSGDLAKDPAATKAVAIGGVVAGASLLFSPLIQSEVPVNVVTDFENLVLKPLLPIGPDGCGQALFFARKTQKDVGFIVP